MLTVKMEAASSPKRCQIPTRLHGMNPAVRNLNLFPANAIRSNQRNETYLLDLVPYLQQPQTLFGVLELHHFQLKLLHGYLFSSSPL